MGSEERFSADTRGRIAIIRIAGNLEEEVSLMTDYVCSKIQFAGLHWTNLP